MLRSLTLTALTLIALVCAANHVQATTTYQLASPNRKINVHIRVDQRIEYDLLLNGRTLLKDSTFALDVDHRKLGLNPQVLSATPTSVKRELSVPVPQKFAVLHEEYNQLRLEFKGGYSVVFRAYNNGVAYRFETSLPQPEVTVYDEGAALNFADNFHVYYPKEDSFFSHNEREFNYLALKDISSSTLASIPAVVDIN